MRASHRPRRIERADAEDRIPAMSTPSRALLRALALLRVQSEQRVQRVNLYLALGGNFAGNA